MRQYIVKLPNLTYFYYLYENCRHHTELCLFSRQSVCEIESGFFRPNIETDESAYFGLEGLPVLAKEKNNEEQIKMCFSAYHDKNWQVLFD